MPDAVIQPLEVFILDADFKRLTGSIPYDSLVWRRRYYGVGEFQMQVRSSLYSTDWAYVYCEDRPETGIIQKVEYDDTTEGPRNGEDTVIVSGFFLEEVLNRLVFLVEESETQEIKHVVPKPTRLSVSKPQFKQDADGNIYTIWGNGTINNCMTGEAARVEDSQDLIAGLTDADVQPGKGIYEQVFNAGQGDYTTGLYSSNYSYVSEDGKLHVLDARDETQASFDIVGDPSSGLILYKDTDGSTKWVNGAVESYEDTYRRKRQRWENYASDENGNRYYVEYREVEGPWMLRADLDDVTSPQDNVQWIMKMAQKTFEGNFIYDKVDFEGETKTLSPSLARIGDWFYQELQTVEASLRVLYLFEADQMVFQLWRGMDRTQDAGGQTPVEPVALMAEPMVASDATDADDYPLPVGYTALEYIQGTGTQYIKLDFTPDSNTRVVLDHQLMETSGTYAVFGSRTSASSADTFCVFVVNGQVRTDFAANENDTFIATTSRETLDKNGRVTTYNGLTSTLSAATFTCPRPMVLFSVQNASGSPGSVFDNQVDNRLAKMRLYSCRIYDDGVLVRNLIPVTGPGGAGVYDLITDTFYGNSGTGAFTIGSQIPRPGGVPDGYDELQYIESTGTQNIDTNFNPGCYTRCVVDFEASQNFTNNHGLFGARNSVTEDAFTAWLGDGFVGPQFFNTAYDANKVTVIYENRRLLYDFDEGTFRVDGQTKELPEAQFRSSSTLRLLAIENSGSADPRMASGKLYAATVYENGIPIRDMVPVKRSSDNEIGLFDLVHQMFYGNAGSGDFIAGPGVQVSDSLTYQANGGEGSMDPTTGYVGDAVTVAACAFTRDGFSFVSWNTSADGTGTSYAPIDQYVLTSGADVLYAIWEEVPEHPTPDEPGAGAPWAVFSDTWGTLYGYKASHDTSNYRNKCYVMYDYQEPVWESGGHRVQVDDDGDGVYDRWAYTGYAVEQKRGYWVVRLEDGRPDAEVWLDLRGDEFPGMENFESNGYQDYPPSLDFTKDDFDAWVEAQKERGRTLLRTEYSDVDNLDTGTITTMRYLADYDLGDKVDLAVEAIGMTKTARVTEVEEVYESGSAEIHLTMGEELLTTDKKSLLV